MSHPPKVAVVILSWNGLKFLEEFLPYLVKTTYTNVDLYVADNASTDNSVPWLKDNYPEVKVIQNPENKGFATGYNQALKHVEADYYVLLNQDVEVTPGWIEPVIKLMETDDNIGACQPKFRAFHDKKMFEYAGAAGGFMDTYGYAFCRGRVFDVVEEDKGQYDSVTDLMWASGAALFIRSTLYHELGGLDDDFFAHMEEIDLCWRLKNTGYTIKYCPDSLVYHVGGGSLPKGNPRKTYLNFRNSLSMMMKNLPDKGFKRTIFLRYMLDIVAAYRALFRGQFKEFWAIARAHRYFAFHFFGLLRKRSKTKALTASIRAKQSASPNRKGFYKGMAIVEYYLKKRTKFSDFPADRFN